MYKLKLLAITAVAIIGALLIYNHFDNKRQELPVIDKFSSEYNLVSEDNIYEYKTIDEIITTLSSGTGFVFFCTPESNWCNYYASELNEVLKENNIEVINYYNIQRDRQSNTMKYQKILDLLNSHIYVDDTNNVKLYMPDLTIVKDGEILAHDNETSLIASDIKPEEYWTESKKQEFKNKINEFVKLLNN